MCSRQLVSRDASSKHSYVSCHRMAECTMTSQPGVGVEQIQGDSQASREQMGCMLRSPVHVDTQRPPASPPGSRALWTLPVFFIHLQPENLDMSLSSCLALWQHQAFVHVRQAVSFSDVQRPW